MDKKGQGMSVNVIIIAAIALIVLVVLVVIFTGRTAIFKSGVEKTSDTELISMRIGYGDCHPSMVAEGEFKVQFGLATTDVAKEDARNRFKENINLCNQGREKTSCGTGCSWQ